MNPTKEEIDQLISQYEADGDFYHMLGLHNRKLARQKIDEFRRRKNDIKEPLTQFLIDGRGEHRKGFAFTAGQLKDAVQPSTQLRRL